MYAFKNYGYLLYRLVKIYQFSFIFPQSFISKLAGHVSLAVLAANEDSNPTSSSHVILWNKPFLAKADIGWKRGVKNSMNPPKFYVLCHSHLNLLIYLVNIVFSS